MSNFLYAAVISGDEMVFVVAGHHGEASAMLQEETYAVRRVIQIGEASSELEEGVYDAGHDIFYRNN